MQQNLTEEQIQERQDIFFNFLDCFIEENYDVPEGYVMSEEDAYITSILLDYFEENYKFPTLKESAFEAMTGSDINSELYDDLYEVLLDESIGSFVAGARYGIKDYFAKKAKERATAKAGAAKSKSDVMQAKAKSATASASKAASGKSPLQRAKYAFSVNKARAVSNKADKAKDAYKAAETRRKSKAATSGNVSGRRQALAQKIDTGVQNIKNRAKSAIASGASKVGGFLGKVAGKLA